MASEGHSESFDPFARFRPEIAALNITAATKVSEYIQKRLAEEREDRLRAEEREREDRLREEERQERVRQEMIRAEEREHEKAMAEMELRRVEAEETRSRNSEGSTLRALHRVKLNAYREGEDIDAFISRFERLAKLYQMESEEKAIEFYSLFTGKALSIVHGLGPEDNSYEHMKCALLKAFGRTAEAAKQAFRSAAISDNETAVQAHARISRLFDERVQKEGIYLTYEALRELVIRDRFEEMCPPEFVATTKATGNVQANKMAENLDLHFSAHGRKNVPRVRSAGSGNKAQPNDPEPVRKEQAPPPFRQNKPQGHPREGSKFQPPRGWNTGSLRPTPPMRAASHTGKYAAALLDTPDDIVPAADTTPITAVQNHPLPAVDSVQVTPEANKTPQPHSF